MLILLKNETQEKEVQHSKGHLSVYVYNLFHLSSECNILWLFVMISIVATVLFTPQSITSFGTH